MTKPCPDDNVERRIACIQQVTRMDQQMSEVCRAVSDIRTDLHDIREKFTPLLRIRPIEWLVYGFAGLILSGVVAAGVTMIVGSLT